MKRVPVGVSILFVLALLAGSFGAVLATGPDGLVTEYPLPGNPSQVASEESGRVWVTLPAAIGAFGFCIRDAHFAAPDCGQPTLVSSQFSGALPAVAGLLTQPRRARSETGPSCPDY